MINRRQFVGGAAAVAAGSSILKKLEAADKPVDRRTDPVISPDGSNAKTGNPELFAPGEPGKDYNPVITPNNISLPWNIKNGVKVYHLIAEPVRHEFAPGLVAECWGYNGHVHGPTIEALDGDRIRIYVTNRLPAATSVHWHGILLPNGMDGVAGLNQKAIQPGETFKYEFTLRQHGTFMYHSHHDEMTQMALGLMGMFIIHPRNPKSRPDRDFALMTSEWKIPVGTSRPDPNEMTDFNIFTFNAKAFPGTEPLVVKLGEKVRIRFGNLSAMSHHPIHLHGYQFKITETGGGEIAESAQLPEVTALTAAGTTRTIEFVADAPGDWPMHCHMTHHVMNQMGHQFGNMIGVNTEGLTKNIRRFVPGYMTMGQEGMGDMGDMGMKNPKNSIPMVGAPGPFDYITMGGMFTILKVRAGINSYADPGWYENPPGTTAEAASEEDLKRDEIKVDAVKRTAVGLNRKDEWCGPRA
ncbi:MAG: multicopper oxidase protein [Verrucomicrobiales bacterium]|nr:multicopper oxidase protein [Verrucomicrobiales bacterium]